MDLCIRAHGVACVLQDPVIIDGPGDIPRCRMRIGAMKTPAGLGGTDDQDNLAMTILLSGSRANYAIQYLRKGSLIYFDGRLAQHTWDDRGKPRRSHFLIASSIAGLRGNAMPLRTTKEVSKTTIASAPDSMTL